MQFCPAQLSDVRSAALKSRLSLFCTVAEGQSVFRTRDGRFFTNLTLVCSSLGEDVVELSIFFSKRRDFPRLRRPGDVAFLHNVVVGEYEGERNLKLSLERCDGGCAFFDPVGGAEPYATYGVVPRYDDVFLEFAKDFSAFWRMDSPDHYVTAKERTLDRLEVATEMDLGCYVWRVEMDRDPKLLWVWDGRDVDPVEMRKPHSEEALRMGFDFLQKCSAVQQPCALDEGELPNMGSLVAIAVVGERRWEETPNGWVKFRNLAAVRYLSQWILLFTDETRWAAVPALPSVEEVYALRVAQNETAQHKGAVVTGVTNAFLVPVTLRTVHAFLHRARSEGREVQEDFRCFVYLMDCEPNVDSIAEAAADPAVSFAAELQLQDATGRCTAMLRGPHAYRFFSLHQLKLGADQPQSSQWKHALITSTLTRAIVSNHPVPWLDVCLRVIYRSGVQAIQILDTTLVSA